jgi:hypothetical protein
MVYAAASQLPVLNGMGVGMQDNNIASFLKT